MKKIINIIFAIISALLIGFYVFLTIAFGDKKEAVRLVNYRNGEKIFLLKTTWGNDERMAIGLDKKLKGGFGNIYPEKYNADHASLFFYKLSEDTLFVYNGRFEKPEINKFRTHIKLIELEGYDFNLLCKNNKYKELGLKVFPESEMTLIDSIGN
jgi:hypothetical protein